MSRSAQKPRFNIEVTEGDIERAHIGDSYKCVVAQAIARAIPDAGYIEVDTQSVRFTKDEQRFIYLTPYAVQGYVIAFDAGESIEPFAFQLRNPQLVARRRLTAAGRDAQQARSQAKAKAKASSSAPTAASPDMPSPPLEVTLGPPDDEQVREAAKAAYADARKVHKGAPTIKTTTGRKSPPRVFKSKRRAYGHRMLRINQEA